MKIIAKTVKGKEFLYSAKSAHKVSAKSAERIRDALNDHKRDFGLHDDEIFYIYDVDEFDIAYEIAQRQSYVIKNGYLCEKVLRY